MAISLEQFNALLAGMQEANANMISKILDERESKGGKNNHSLVDTRGVGRPKNFEGKEDRYNEWITKFMHTSR